MLEAIRLRQDTEAETLMRALIDIASLDLLDVADKAGLPNGADCNRMR